MNVVLLSSFRDAMRYLRVYAEQVRQLAGMLAAQGDALHCVWCEGDSADNSYAALLALATRDRAIYRAEVIRHEHSGPHYGSIEHPQRFAQLAGVGNALLGHVPVNADAVLLAESDLLWDGATLVTLLGHLARVPAVAPMVMDGDASFYDVYAFRRNGVRFTKEPPYHADLPGATGLLQLDSAGSVLAVRGELARRARFPREDVIVGLCRQLYESGASVWVDPGLRVDHP